MENNNTNTPEMIPEETLNKIDAGKKIVETAEKLLSLALR